MAFLNDNADHVVLVAASLLLLLLLRRFVPGARMLVPGVLVLAVLAGGWWFVTNAEKQAREGLARVVENAAPTYAQELESMGHAELPSKIRLDDPRYLAMVAAQKRWLSANPSIADIYTFRRRDDGRIVLFVDSETDYDRDGEYEGERESRTVPGEEYEALPTLERAFLGESAFDGEPSTDRWGFWVSAYHPMYGEDGRVEAVLGVDFDAAAWARQIRRSRLEILVWLSVLVLALAVGGALSEALHAALIVRRDAERELRGRSDELIRAKTDLETQAVELKRSNRELEEARFAAEAANRAKSEFLANMSHELRTPLHAILSFARFGLRSRDVPREDLQDYFRTIETSGKSLLVLLNDLLDLAKLEAGRMRLDLAPVDAILLVAAVVDEFQPFGLENSTPIELSEPGMASLEIQADRARILQVLRNILSNAIKFSKHDGQPVEVGLSLRGDWVCIAVRDHGIGIPEIEQDAVFEKFVQSSKTRSTAGGTGLGLAISREIVSLHGGRIHAKTASDGGAVVICELPIGGAARTAGGGQDGACERFLLSRDHDLNSSSGS